MTKSTVRSNCSLALFYPGAIAFEIQLALELLAKSSNVRVVTPNGEPHAASNGLRIAADLALAAASPSDVGAILIPGGDPGSIFQDERLHQLLRDAHARGAVLGAICAGPLVLAAAGLLDGKQVTHGYGPAQEPYVGRFFAGATVLREKLVVTDGSIVTARAEGYVDFALAMARATGAIADEQELARRARFYRGEIS